MVDSPRHWNTGSTPGGLHESRGVTVDLRIGLEVWKGDAGNRYRHADLGRRGSNESLTVVSGIHDLPVVDLDPGGETIGEAKAIVGAQRLEVTRSEVIWGRRVVMTYAQVHGHPHQTGHGFRRNP
jgi:hypothetical protein